MVYSRAVPLPIVTIGLTLAAAGLRIFGPENKLLDFAAHPLDLVSGHLLAEGAEELARRVRSYERITNRDLDRAVAKSALLATQFCLVDAFPRQVERLGPWSRLRNRLRKWLPEVSLQGVIVQGEESAARDAIDAIAKRLKDLEEGTFVALRIDPLSLVLREPFGDWELKLAREAMAEVRGEHANLPDRFCAIFQGRWFSYLCLAFQEEIKTNERVFRIFQSVQAATGFAHLEDIVSEEGERGRKENRKQHQETHRLLGEVRERLEETLPLVGHSDNAVRGLTNHITLTEDNSDSSGLTATATARLTIGRGPSNSLVIPDETVSWEHGEIVLRDGAYCYRHLSRSNPAILRRRGAEYLFRPGKHNDRSLLPHDRLIVGDHSFVVQFTLVTADGHYVTTKRAEE